MSSLIVPNYLPPSAQLDRPLPRVDTILLNAHETFPFHPSLDHQIGVRSTKAHEDDIREQISNLGKLQDSDSR